MARYNINGLDRLSEHLGDFHRKFVALLSVFGHFLPPEPTAGFLHEEVDFSMAPISDADIYRWEIDSDTFSISRPDSPEEPTLEMAATLEAHSADLRTGMLAVAAYMICFGSNPYMGKGYYDRVVLTPEWETSYFGKDRRYALDKTGLNSPDPFYQKHTLQSTASALAIPVVEKLNAWFETSDADAIASLPAVVYDMLAGINTAPSAGFRRIIENRQTGDKYLLANGKILVNPDYRVAGVMEQKTVNGREDLYLRNMTEMNWVVFTSSRNVKEVKPGEEIPVRPGMSIGTPGAIWSVLTD